MPYGDWDDLTKQFNIPIAKAFSEQQREVRLLLLLFSVENVLLCLPVWILLGNITARDAYLKAS